MTETTVTRGRVAVLVAVAAGALGLVLSTYLTIEHYSHATTFACPESATINCLKVTTSKWSTIAGVPVAVAGLAYFAVMTVLSALRSDDRRLALLRLAGAVAGVGMVVYLVYVEVFDVNAICLWCTGVHLCTLVLFAAVLARTVDSMS